MFKYICIARRSIALILALVSIASLTACTGTRGRNRGERPGDRTVSMALRTDDTKEIDKYLSGILGFDFGEYTKEAEMELNDMSKDGYAMIRILVKDDRVEDLKAFMEENLGKGQEYTNDLIPGFQDHEYVLELKQMTPVSYHTRFRQGTDIKSIPGYFYLAEDNGNTYLFIFA